MFLQDVGNFFASGGHDFFCTRCTWFFALGGHIVLHQADMIFCTRWTWWGVSNQWVNCRQPKPLVGSFHIASSFHKTELHLLALCVALIRCDFFKLRVLQYFYFWATKSFGYEAANDIKYSFNDLFQVNSWLRGGTTRNRPSSGNPSTFSQPRQKPSQSGWFCSGTSCAPQKRKRRGTKPNWSQSGRNWDLWGQICEVRKVIWTDDRLKNAN